MSTYKFVRTVLSVLVDLLNREQTKLEKQKQRCAGKAAELLEQERRVVAELSAKRDDLAGEQLAAAHQQQAITRLTNNINNLFN